MLTVAAVLGGLILLSGCGDNGGDTTTVPTTGAAKRAQGPLRTYRVPAGSMEPTLSIGARVQVEARPPHLGDIVVLHPPEGALQEECGSGSRATPGGAACSKPLSRESSLVFIKRIVAGPGDTIKVVEGHVIRNGQHEQDPYIRPCPGVPECNFPVPIKVPAGNWYLLGDNRGESDDSRIWGPVPPAWIIGVVVQP